VARADGMRFLVRCDNFVDRHILYYGEFEAEQIAYLGQQIALRNVDTFVDVGANFGYYTVMAALRWRLPHLVAVEADPRNYLHLCASLFLNGLAGKVRTHEVAASSQAGTIGFVMSKDSATGCSHIVNGDTASISVPTRPLDGVIDATGRNVAFKIDVEGHELAVLEGMARLLRENDCVLQIESFRKNATLVEALLIPLGYARIHQIGDDHYFARSAISP